MKKPYNILRLMSFIFAALLLFFCASCQKSDPLYTAGDSSFYVSLFRPTDDDGELLDDAAMQSAASTAKSEFSKTLTSLSDGEMLADINSDVDVILDCDAELLNILSRALTLCERTEGLFQPCAGAYTSLVRSGAATDEELQAALSHISADSFEISDANIKKTDRLAAFDLYAVADALSLQKAVESLESQNIACGTLSTANTTAVFGEKTNGEKFNVALPDGEGYIGWFTVPQGYISYVDENSTVYDLGMGTNEFSRVAVYAADGITAAAIANAVWIGGVEGERRLGETLDGTYCMVAVTKGGEVITSAGAISSGLFVMSPADGEQ